MSKLMTAEAARKAVEEMQDALGEQLKEEARRCIESAVAKGKRCASMSVRTSDHKRLKRWLADLGYQVDCGDSQRDGPWCVIRW